MEAGQKEASKETRRNGEYLRGQRMEWKNILGRQTSPNDSFESHRLAPEIIDRATAARLRSERLEDHTDWLYLWRRVREIDEASALQGNSGESSGIPRLWRDLSSDNSLEANA